jgi:integrase
MWVTVGKREDRSGWWVTINYKGARKKKGFGDDKNGAKAYASQLLAKFTLAKVTGEPILLSQPDQAMPTVKHYLEEWLKTYAEPHCKPSTYRGYKRAVDKQLIPAFGDRLLHVLKRSDVQGLIAKLTNDKKSRGTIKNCMVPLKAAYHQAIEEGIVTFNPAVRLGRLIQGRQDKRAHIQPLTQDELSAVLKLTEERYQNFHPVLLCAARTGLRLGELIGLQWGDIDFSGGFMEVRRAVVLREETDTKSHKIRRVDMSQQLQAELRRLKEVRQLEAMSKGEAIERWVFLSPKGQRWDDRNLRRTWYQCLEQAEIRHVRFHDLRHTYVSLLIQKGAHPKYIQEQAGHSSIQVTMDTYGHLFPSANRGWADTLDEVSRKSSAPILHPAAVAGKVSQNADGGKPLDSEDDFLVAVPRIERGTRGL